MVTTDNALPPTLDMTMINMLRTFREAGEPDPVEEIASMFVIDGHERLTTMRVALAAGDEPTARRAAHSLRGMSGSIGAARLTALTQDFESAGPGAIDSTRLRQLEHEFARVSQALRAA